MDKKNVDILTTAIKANLGPEVEIKVEPYSIARDIMVKDWGVLVVYVSPKEKGEVSYKTWFKGGMLSEQESKE